MKDLEKRVAKRKNVKDFSFSRVLLGVSIGMVFFLSFLGIFPDSINFGPFGYSASIFLRNFLTPIYFEIYFVEPINGFERGQLQLSDIYRDGVVFKNIDWIIPSFEKETIYLYSQKSSDSKLELRELENNILSKIDFDYDLNSRTCILDNFNEIPLIVKVEYSSNRKNKILNLLVILRNFQKNPQIEIINSDANSLEINKFGQEYGKTYQRTIDLSKKIIADGLCKE